MKNRYRLNVTVVAALSCSCLLTAEPALAGDNAAAAIVAAPTALLLGTPIAAIRCSLRSIKSIYHEYDNGPLCWKVMGRPCAVPIGAVEGTVKGLIAGPRNALRFAGDKPFSKESFSLDSLD